jgi:hypothetical protein
MPASGIRVTYKWEAPRRGIGEVFIFAADTVAAAIEPAKALAKARKKLMGRPMTLFGCVLSKEGVRRDSQVFTATQLAEVNTVPYALTGANASVTDNSTGQANDCLNVRIEASDVSRRTLFMAGVPDACLRMDPESPPIDIPVPWLDAFDAWSALLINAPWSFIGKRTTQIVGDGLVAYPVLLANRVGAPPQAVISTSTRPGGWQVGEFVQLRGFRSINRAYVPWQGEWQIAAVTPDAPAAGQSQLQLRNSTSLDPDTIARMGTVEQVDFTSRKIARVILQRQTTRKRGNRFLAPPGRLTVPVRI